MLIIPEHPHISICVCTYKRPALLSRLLKRLKTQQTDDYFTFSIVVIDNDFQRSAEAVIDTIRADCAISIDYHVEPEQNIALARNKAIENARGHFVAFIDDDELPIDTWLLNHFKCIRDSGADGSLGPVLPLYEATPPRWLIKGGFYDRPSYKTGRILHPKETRSGNVLMGSDIFSANEHSFDPRLGSGGEDKEFFRRKITEGRIFIWCAAAAVYESVPAVRMTRSFMIRRGLLRGQAKAKGFPLDIVRMIKSLAAISVYTLALPVTMVLGHHLFLSTLIKSCDHLGEVVTRCGIELIKEKYVME